MTTLSSLLETYPGASKAARRGVKNRQKKILSDISALGEYRDNWSLYINRLNFRQQPIMRDLVNSAVVESREIYDKELQKCAFDLVTIDSFEKKERGEAPPQKQTGVTDEQIARAKEYPIADLLPVKRGTTLCIFHDDKNPSLRVYKDNHAHCFACGAHADSIDIYMALSGEDFLTSVRHLAP